MNCTHHVNQASINSSFLAQKISLPLPPLSEQFRIVSKLEELFTKLEAGIDALKKTKIQLKKYRQSILKYAFEGRLTETWRNSHRNEIESDSIDSYKEEYKKNLKSRNLPKGWALTILEEITDYVEKIDPKNDPNKEFIYLDIASIDHQQKIANPKKYFGKDAPSRARQLVRTGDIIFSTVRTYLKNIATVNDIYDRQIASTGFCVIRPVRNVNNKFIFFLSLTDGFINSLTKIQRHKAWLSP